MRVKMFEVRDVGTLIPVVAIWLESDVRQERYLLARSGYANPEGYVFVAKIDGGEGRGTSDPYVWAGRTMQVAHTYIREKFPLLETGAVVDVQFILGETAEPKASESTGAYGCDYYLDR